jgi:hypothetical protein
MDVDIKRARIQVLSCLTISCHLLSGCAPVQQSSSPNSLIKDHTNVMIGNLASLRTSNSQTSLTVKMMGGIMVYVRGVSDNGSNFFTSAYLASEYSGASLSVPNGKYLIYSVGYSDSTLNTMKCGFGTSTNGISVSGTVGGSTGPLTVLNGTDNSIGINLTDSGCSVPPFTDGSNTYLNSDLSSSRLMLLACRGISGLVSTSISGCGDTNKSSSALSIVTELPIGATFETGQITKCFDVSNTGVAGTAGSPTILSSMALPIVSASGGIFSIPVRVSYFPTVCAVHFGSGIPNLSATRTVVFDPIAGSVTNLKFNGASGPNASYSNVPAPYLLYPSTTGGTGSDLFSYSRLYLGDMQ